MIMIERAGLEKMLQQKQQKGYFHTNVAVLSTQCAAQDSYFNGAYH